MRRPLRWSFILPGLMLFSLATLPATAQQYQFHTYTEQNGLPSGHVLSMAQDAEGLLWFGTPRGLARSDGVVWEVVGPVGGQATMRHPFVGRDHRDRMWTIGQDPRRRLYVRESDAWQVFEFPGGPLGTTGLIAHVLGRTPDGETLLATADRDTSLAVFVGGRWRQYSLGAGGGRFTGLAFADGRLAIGTTTGLYTIDPADWQLRKTPLGESVLAVCPDFEGSGLWVVGEDWIGRGTADSLSVVVRGLSLNLAMPYGGTAALADRTGGLFLGDLAHVYFFHPRFGLTRMARADGLRAPSVNRFFLDREGHVWVAGVRGVSKLVNRSFAGYDRQQGLLDDEVSAILRRSDGRVVLGHFSGLTFMDSIPRTLNFGRGNYLRERVIDLAESPGGEVWLAADGLGVGRLRPDDTVEFLDRAEGAPTSAYALAFDGKGRLWVGSDQGLTRWDGTRFLEQELPGPGTARGMLIRRLLPARDGSLLVASGHHGLYRWRDGAVTWYEAAAESPGRQLFTMHETLSGELLLGSVLGLYTVRGDSVVPAPPPWPDINRPVYSILTDAAGRLWLGTDNGVLRWDGITLVHLTNRDGVLGTEANRDALQLGPNEEVWIGTDRGLTVYREELNLPPLAPPLVSLTGYEVDGVTYPADQPLQLDRPARALEISFRGVTFGDELRTRYLTWLENFEDAWQGPEQVPDRTVRYTNVPPGSYRFHVKVMTAEGAVSPAAVGGPITIKPPLLVRPWFVGLLVLGVMAVLWLTALLVSGRRYARHLRATVQERTADLVRSEQQVRAESQRLGATLESISDGVISLDRDGRVIMFNSAAERFLADGGAAVSGVRLADALSIEPALNLAPGPATTHVLTDGSGRQAWVELSVAPITDPELGEIGQVLAFRDITERRDMEDRRARTQRLESLGVLAGGIAHDFNNLLTVILGNLSLLEGADSVGAEEQGQMERIKEATEGARALTEQFLTFARGGAPNLAPSDLRAIVQRAAGMAFSGKQVGFTADLANDLANVMVDRGQIGQVLQNLLLNACQAMPAGGRVVVRGYNRPGAAGEDQAQVCLEIEDQGCGIAPENLARIFEPYFTTKTTGSGLGLAVAHSIVQRHGGRLTVASELGQGTVFTMVLPATSRPVAAVDAPQASAPAASARILIMDDEPGVATICTRMLGALGHNCGQAADGEQALREYAAARAAGAPYDAVIMDLTIPSGMGGREAMQQLLVLDPQARAIVASGYSHDPVIADYRQFGFKGVLRKPYNLATLKRVVGEVLAGADTAI